MKKITITIALMLVVALAMPAFGAGHGSFSDVPGDHWAYDAINKLVAAGIVEGYPDGEYKGEQSMTRYEMAVLISRALDNIVDEQEAMAEDMEAMGQGLTTGQAEDVTAIVKSLMEKNIPEQDSLSDAQAEEVADIVDALTFELAAELKVLGADVDALGTDVENLEAKVDALDIPEDNIEFTATVDTIAEVGNYNGSAVDLIEDGDARDDDAFATKEFYQEAGIGISGSVANAEYNLDLVTLANYFGEFNSEAESEVDTFEMDSALLEVAYEGVNVKLGDLNDYAVEPYFVNELSVEGMEMTTDYMGYDVKTFVASEEGGDDIYGANVGRDLDIATVTGKVYQARNSGPLATVVAGSVTGFEPTDMVTMGAEVAYELENEGVYAKADTTVEATEELTVTGLVEYAQDSFEAYQGDLEANTGGFLLADVDADYDLDDNNTLKAGVKFLDTNTADNEIVVNGGIANTYGDFTNNANVDYFVNDGAGDTKIDATADTAYAYNEKTTLKANVQYIVPENDDNTTVLGAGVDYAWNDSTDLGAAFTYKTVENGMNYSFVNLTADKTLTDNISWNTEAHYVTGEDENTDSGDGNGVKTSLSVSF